MKAFGGLQGLSYWLLSLCPAYEEEGDDGKDDVGEPCGEDGRPVAVDGERGADGLQEDVSG